MTDVWEIAAYVEEHPDDHPQRWRLAKKFYAEHEYRLALDHLQLLQKEWTPKLNVQRYLAATYYRLGRYTEAEEHLEKTIKQWPDEVGPCEQLAHVYNVDGKLEEALRTWKKVVQIQPDHALAGKAIKKLESALEKEDREKVAPVSGLFPADLTDEEKEDLMVTGMICPRCGAQNSDEFETCWQCNASLRMQTPSFLNTPPIEVHGPYLLRPETATTLVLVVTVLLLAASAILGAWLIMEYRAEETPLLFSMEDVGRIILAPARLASGIVMLLCWPFALLLALRVFRVKPSPPGVLVYISGLLLGALTLLFILMPMPFPFLAVLVSLVLSLGIIIVALRISTGPAFAVWLTHIVLIGCIGALAFWIAESRRYGKMINPFREIAAFSAALSGPGALPDAVPIRLPKGITPIQQKVRWKSTGSEWLDTPISMVEIVVRPEFPDPALQFQIYQGKELRYHEELLGKQQITVPFSVFPGVEYEVVVKGKDNVIVPVTIKSLMPFEFLE